MQEIVTEQDSMLFFIPRQHTKEFLRKEGKASLKYPQFLIRIYWPTEYMWTKHTEIHERPRPLQKLSSEESSSSVILENYAKLRGHNQKTIARLVIKPTNSCLKKFLATKQYLQII